MLYLIHDRLEDMLNSEMTYQDFWEGCCIGDKDLTDEEVDSLAELIREGEFKITVEVKYA